MGPGNTVRTAFNHHQFAAFDDRGHAFAGVREWYDPVLIAVDDQHWYIHALEIVSKVGTPGVDAIERALGRSGNGNIPARLHRLFAGERAAEDVKLVEVQTKL